MLICRKKRKNLRAASVATRKGDGEEEKNSVHRREEYREPLASVPILLDIT